MSTKVLVMSARPGKIVASLIYHSIIRENLIYDLMQNLQEFLEKYPRSYEEGTMTDTVVETTAPKSVGPGKVKSIALNIIPPALFGALVLGGWYFIPM